MRQRHINKSENYNDKNVNRTGAASEVPLSLSVGNATETRPKNFAALFIVKY